MNVQRGWRSCIKCDTLFYAPLASICTKGGSHDGGTRPAYLPYVGGQPGCQENWRWCKRCGVMFFGGGDGGRCRAGGAHDPSGSGNYALRLGPPVGRGQGGWRWCCQCQSLFSMGGNNGTCPATNQAHNASGSSEYSLSTELTGEGVVATFEGKGDSGEIWMTIKIGSSWIAPVRVPGGCSGTPMPIMFEKKLWIFYRGMGNSYDLWYTTYDGFEFSESRQVPGVRTRGVPCPTVVNGSLSVWVQGTSDSKTLWRCRRDTDARWISNDFSKTYHIWNDPAGTTVKYKNGTDVVLVAFERAKCAEAAEVYSATGDLTVAGWKDISPTSSGGHASGSSATPGIVAFKGKVYLFHEGGGHDGNLYVHSAPIPTHHDDRLDFSPASRIPNVGISGTPSPVVDGDTLLVLHEGMGDNGELWCVSTTDGAHWSADQRVSNIGVSGSCGVTRYRFDP